MPIVETDAKHPQFQTPNFGQIDFGLAADGAYSAGYKMIAFEPGKILQAQELNEIQFRMSVHNTLTMQMVSNWLPILINSDFATSTSIGPGWNGATPLTHNNVVFSRSSKNLIFLNEDNLNPDISYIWFLCKLNSNNLYFWLPLIIYENTAVNFDTSSYPVGTYFGLELNTSGGGEYTGELVNCNDVGFFGNHPLTVKNSSVCGSSRYYVKITNIIANDLEITNNFCGIIQKRTDGMYYLNNVKVKEVT